jgi:hypothetical protein
MVNSRTSISSLLKRQLETVIPTAQNVVIVTKMELGQALILQLSSECYEGTTEISSKMGYIKYA